MKYSKWNYIFPAITVILLASFMWIIHDRFIPIQEGWMQYYSLLTQRGLLPYKDFYFFTQPIPLFIIQFISKIGSGYMYFRYYGMVERIILILVLYYLIRKHFSATASFIAVTTSAFLYQSFNIDIFYTYFQTTMLFFLLSLVCLQRGTDSKHSWLYDCLVGVFASLAFFTKQSNGLCVTLVLIFLLVWLTPRKLLLRRVLIFMLGWTIPALLIFGWLEKKGIFSDYLNQVFGGISSKGSLGSILFGFWTRNFALLYLVLFLLFSFILFLLWKKKLVNIQIGPQPEIQLNQFNYLLPIFFLVFMLGGFLITQNKDMTSAVSLFDHYLLLWLYFTFYTSTILTAVILVTWISKKPLPVSKPIAELILASFVWTYSVGLSGQLEEYGTLLGTALIFALLLDRIKVNWKHFTFLLISASCLVIFVCSAKKNQLLYDWWGWAEYGHSESVTSIIPAFKGFKLSPETGQIYDKIYLDIINNTTPSDYVYTYPFITLFNYVTDRLQPTFSPVGYFDVCPDNIAIMDAEKLKSNPPKMIVYMKMPQSVYKIHEQIFRNGQPSGQRYLDAAITEIVDRYHYKKIDSFLSPEWNWPIYVWLKP